MQISQQILKKQYILIWRNNKKLYMHDMWIYKKQMFFFKKNVLFFEQKKIKSEQQKNKISNSPSFETFLYQNGFIIRSQYQIFNLRLMTRNDQIERPRGRRFGRTRFLRRNRDENRDGQARRRPFRRGRPNREGEDRNRPRRNPEDRKNRRRGSRENRGTRKRQNADSGDLDRQLKNYWINQKDSSKSKEELKQIASKKFNDQLQDYWKKQKKDVQE